MEAITTPTETTTKKMSYDQALTHRIGKGKHNGMNCAYIDNEEAAKTISEDMKAGWRKGYGIVYGPFVEKVAPFRTYWEVTGFHTEDANDYVREHLVGSGRATPLPFKKKENA